MATCLPVCDDSNLSNVSEDRPTLSTDMAKQTIICVNCYADWFNLSDCIFYLLCLFISVC